MTGASKGRAAWIAALVLAMLAISGVALADSTLVVLTRPASTDAGAAEIVNRIRGELVADGFDVQLIEAVPPSERATMLARSGREADAAVTAGVFLEGPLATIELCLVDALTGRVLVRRLEARPGPPEAPEVLARRTVDMLRASLLELLVESLRARSAGPHAAAAKPESSEPAAPSVWSLEGGLGVLGSFDGVGPAVLPVARLGLALRPTLQLRLTGAYLGTRPRVEVAAGAATIEQGLALVEGTVELLPNERIRPLLSLGIGAYYVAVSGTGAAPYQDGGDSEVAFAAGAGAGLGMALTSHLDLLVEAQVIATAPGIAIRFLDEDAARIGRPSVLGTVAFAGRP